MKYLRIILPRGKGSKFMDILKQMGASWVTCILAEGCAKAEILDMLEIDKVKKEIVLALIEDEKLDKLIDRLKEKLDKANSSILFATNLENKGDEKMEYEAIYVIVNREDGEKVVNLAQENGAKGATIVHGRGSGIEKKSLFLNMKIEPEKDLVIMVVKKEMEQTIKDTIYQEMNLGENSKGIIYSLPVSDVRGLVDQN